MADARFDRIPGGARLTHRREQRLPALVAVPLVLGAVVVAGVALALGAHIAVAAAPLVALALARARYPRAHVLTVADGVVTWKATLGAARTLALADVLELEQRDQEVIFKLRDGSARRVPVPGPGIATSSFLSIVRQGRG